MTAPDEFQGIRDALSLYSEPGHIHQLTRHTLQRLLNAHDEWRARTIPDEWRPYEEVLHQNDRYQSENAKLRQRVKELEEQVETLRKSKGKCAGVDKT